MLVQCLHKSLSPDIYYAEDNGENVLEIWSEIYLFKGKPQIISLTSQRKSTVENIIDDKSRKCCHFQKVERIHQWQLINLKATDLRDFPSELKPFTTVIPQKEQTLTFSIFNITPRKFKEMVGWLVGFV